MINQLNKFIICILVLTTFSLAYSYNEKAYEYYDNGVKLSESKDFIEAIKQFDKAISIEKNYKEAWLNKGVAYYE